jgi:hypothetical protein
MKGRRLRHGLSILLTGSWLSEFTDLRDMLNKQDKSFCAQNVREIAEDVIRRIETLGRDYPIPKLSERALARLEREAAVAAAIAEQKREEAALEGMAEGRPLDSDARQVMVA